MSQLLTLIKLALLTIFACFIVMYSPSYTLYKALFGAGYEADQQARAHLVRELPGPRTLRLADLLDKLTDSSTTVYNCTAKGTCP
jgi:hypothetical protein